MAAEKVSNPDLILRVHAFFPFDDGTEALAIVTGTGPY
jgi:hypothetical protein